MRPRARFVSTTRTSVRPSADAAFRFQQNAHWQPALRISGPFYDRPAYIAALRQTAEKHLSSLSWAPEKVIISFHGTPKRHLNEGDPYYCHCKKTARLLREAMGWAPDFSPVAFQSKFGREEWLSPATNEMILSLVISMSGII